MATLAVEQVAATLEGLEETIIHKLIDRAQFRRNLTVYRPGQSGFEGDAVSSLFEIRLRQHEVMDAEFGRFHVPEERPFTSPLPASRRLVSIPENILMIDDYDSVNLTARIQSDYLSFVSQLCADGDDLQYGSSVEHDVQVLQAVSRRIHFGAMYVAEVKFRSNPTEYRRLIEASDRIGLVSLLTRPEAEIRILERVREKVAYIQARVNTSVRSLVDADVVLNFYRDTVIPLTKDGEVLYLFNRRNPRD